ncbi:hypothetical protein ACFQU9_01000 [Actinomadura namibiensis]|uniref:Uncharacterized protein n=1 Tax=Actinomadura namibiensis TaxID=182080 RepID=A0A7W3LN81_ACTNM|nr:MULTISPECIES: hypothetical protein [Actinomadura]MBA8951217.1 hypothetical protein [Actinomadura namibiensis]
MTRKPESTASIRSVPHRWPTFLRFDRPELDGDEMVIRARPTQSRARTRTSPAVPLAYLYEPEDEFEPESTVRMSAGHYDADRQVWVFSGDVRGLVGITEPTTS